MGQGMKWADGNEVSGAQRAPRAFREVGLRNLFDNGLGHKGLQSYCDLSMAVERRCYATVTRARAFGSSDLGHAASSRFWPSRILFCERRPPSEPSVHSRSRLALDSRLHL